ncbi:hypothetical protein OIV83_003989 [Microbotryomycetes sp. JL201]|nr:hypothetical protein OIV83_003989 [Microbotryomycetes sp. JL201]
MEGGRSRNESKLVSELQGRQIALVEGPGVWINEQNVVSKSEKGQHPYQALFGSLPHGETSKQVEVICEETEEKWTWRGAIHDVKILMTKDAHKGSSAGGFPSRWRTRQLDNQDMTAVAALQAQVWDVVLAQNPVNHPSSREKIRMVPVAYGEARSVAHDNDRLVTMTGRNKVVSLADAPLGFQYSLPIRLMHGKSEDYKFELIAVENQSASAEIASTTWQVFARKKGAHRQWDGWRLGPAHSDYDTFDIEWHSHEKYELTRRLGRGKYSEVFAALDECKQVVVKVLKPVKLRKIKREIKVLQALQGGPNIIKLLDTVHDPATNVSSLVFEYINFQDSKLLYPTFTSGDVKFYAYELLKALDFAHSRGIIHRDVKPLNILIDSSTRTLKLIDWGLAEFYHPNVELNCRVASRWYKSPEILLDYPFYNYSLDMWSFGCTLGGMLMQREPLFRGNDAFDQLLKIVKVLGTTDLWKFVDRYRIELSPSMEAAVGHHAKRPWLLIYDHNERLTAAEAMLQPYFDSARQADEQRKKEKKKRAIATAVFSPKENVEQAQVVTLDSGSNKARQGKHASAS